MPDEEFVFGYGSLAGVPGVPCVLLGHRRGWGVAMDNRRTIAGYKYYVDAQTGERPDAHVAFLDVYPTPGDGVNGVAVPVPADGLAALDRRERNYTRIDVTAAVEPSRGRVWMYVGSEAGRRRFQSAERLLVSRPYAERVEAGFAALGPGELERYRASTDPPPCPVADLRRIDVD